jgi:hypothetical protein
VGSNSPHYTPSEADEGGLLNVVVTDANNNVGNITVGIVPLLIVADNSLSISPNGSVGLGLSVVQETNPDDTISVTISFENRNGGADAPTISAGDHATGQPTTHSGATTYTFSADDVNSGLTITNHGDQTDTLTVQEILEGSVVATTQTITVVDPPILWGSSTIHTGETEELTGPATTAVTFANNNGVSGALVLDQSASFTGQITGFTGDGTIANSDTIDLKDINFATARETYAENDLGTGGVLTVGDGTNTAQLDFDGNYQLGNFKFASDDAGGTLVVDPPIAAPSVSFGHQSDSFVFGGQLGQSGLPETHSGATVANLGGDGFAARDYDSFHFGPMTAPPSQPADFSKFGLANAAQDPVHVQQQALVQAVEPAHDLSTFLAGTESIATQPTAAHPDGHFIVRA